MKTNKILMIALALCLISTASAAVLSGYFTHTTHATVDEAIRIDGAESWVQLYGGESTEYEIVINNRASVDITGELKTTYSPDGRGLSTFYAVDGVTLTDADGNGREEITIPAMQTVTVTKVICAMPNIMGGEYTVVTEMKPIDV